jgi:hypothetical protein
MNVTSVRNFLRRAFGPGYFVLLAAGLGLAFLGALPWVAGGLLAGGGATLASGWRAGAPRPWRFAGLVPALGALGILSAYSSVSAISGLAAGLAGLALLLWCAEEPDRAAGALSRGAAMLAVPAAGFGIAWTSSFLLPQGLGTVGVAAALLAASATAVVLLLRTPGTFDRDAAATS